jgi:hypothetical protein
MSNHPYLRAYMAGISVPTPLLLIPLTAFFMARFVYNIPVPVERVIIFPMAIIPNLFGVWNMLHLASRASTRLPLGIHARHFALHHRAGGVPARPQLGLPAYHTLPLHLFRTGADALHISRGRVSLRVDRLLPSLEISDRILQSSCRDSRVART